MQNNREQAYAKRFNRVLDFIEKHLGEDLSIKQMARVASFSTFHFHRQFTDYVGITPSRYVLLAQSPSSFRSNPDQTYASEDRGF